jgi:hypothetical protein
MWTVPIGDENKEHKIYALKTYFMKDTVWHSDTINLVHIHVYYRHFFVVYVWTTSKSQQSILDRDANNSEGCFTTNAKVKHPN